MRDSVKCEKYASLIGKHKEGVGVNGKIILERHSSNGFYVPEVDCFGLRQGTEERAWCSVFWIHIEWQIARVADRQLNSEEGILHRVTLIVI
jgi:hypothetical protein